MRGRSAALSLVVVSTTVLLPGVASAADGSVVESAFDGALAGPVGLGAVAVGVIGLVTGFLRRRQGVAVSEQNQRVVPPAADVPTTAPATTQV